MDERDDSVEGVSCAVFLAIDRPPDGCAASAGKNSAGIGTSDHGKKVPGGGAGDVCS